MTGTTGRGGLKALALGGIGATVVGVGGAVLVWLGVFDTETYRLSTSDPQTELVITPSAEVPSVMQGSSQQPDPEETSQVASSAEQAEVADQAPVQPADQNELESEGAQTGSELAETVGDTVGDDGALATVTPSQTASENDQQIEPVADPVAGVLAAPQLDLVRVDPAGDTVIAGRATAGARVAVLLDGRVLERIDVSQGGEFVAFALIAPSDQARVISLRAEQGDQTTLSETSFILAPAAPVPSATTLLAQAETATPKEEPAVAVSEAAGATPSGVTANNTTAPVESGEQDATETTTGSREAGETSQGQTGVAEGTANAPNSSEVIAAVSVADQVAQGGEPSAPVVTPSSTAQGAEDETRVVEPETKPAAAAGTIVSAETDPAPEPAPTQVAVLRADAQGVTLVQPAAQAPQGKVVLDTIGYSDSGEVQLAGRARANARVRVYLDNAVVTSFVVAQNGSWGGQLEAVDPGVYRLRLDELDTNGKVLSRLETPFKREAPEVLLPPANSDTAPDAAAPLVRAVTVQEGDTLWAISQQRYGSGFLYVRVFEANQAAIRDPDLIYPGQVFAIPE